MFISIIKNTNNENRSAAAIGLANQNLKNNWKKVKKIFIDEKSKNVAKKSLIAIATINSKSALDIIKQAYTSRLYSTARKILEQKGFTNEQILSLKSKKR